MGAHYRHTTPEMAARVVTAIQARLTVVVHAAENPPVTLRVPTAMDRVSGKSLANGSSEPSEHARGRVLNPA
jgi:hypothetical protein